MLGAERGVGSGGEAQADSEFTFIDGKLNGGELELAEKAAWIGCGEDAEAGGKSGGDLGGDEVVLGGGIGVDVETREDFADNGNFKRASARDRSQRDVGAGRDDFVGAGEGVGLRIGGGWQPEHEKRSKNEKCAGAPTDPPSPIHDVRSNLKFERHGKVTTIQTVIEMPRCFERIPPMSWGRVSPVFSRTKAPAESDQASLKLVLRAEIQI